MRKRSARIELISVLLVALAAFPSVAYAYLDPGTGSYLVQLVIASILSALFVVKIYWKKIKDSIRRLLSPSSNVSKKD